MCKIWLGIKLSLSKIQ